MKSLSSKYQIYPPFLQDTLKIENANHFDIKKNNNSVLYASYHYPTTANKSYFKHLASGLIITCDILYVPLR